MKTLVRLQDAPRWMRSASALVLLLLAACGSKDMTNTGDEINCQNDSRVMAYAPNLSVTSPSGRRFILMQSDPAPPAKGTDTWTMRVQDSSGTTLPSLPLWIDPNMGVWMPDHGHGPSVHASVTANGDGTYTVAPLYFFMPGVWRVTIKSAPDAGPNDSAIFYFCVPG